MMRWLKEKKREKRSNSSGYEEDGLEDDYGFEKENRPTSKSPLTKRQLPPTPLTPEEKSPHIYEEIHDLQMVASASASAGILVATSSSSALPLPLSSSLALESGKSSPQKHKKHKHGSIAAAVSGNPTSPQAVTASTTTKPTSTSSTKDINGLTPSKDNSVINPYMVVPVDEEARQTPPNFHRNGTPEVHCDLIIKDTHCEILLSRKPKVGAFRLDSTTSTVGSTGCEGNSIKNNIISGQHPVIRNNTHFCSRNRRASVDVQSASGGGKSGSASSGAWNSSTFSSSSTSRVNSVGNSMMSLSTLSERAPQVLPEDGASSGSSSSAKGVMTYTVGGNFIPRATKLKFQPLKSLECDDMSLSNQDPFFSMMPPPPQHPSSHPPPPEPPHSGFISALKPPAQFSPPHETPTDHSDSPVMYASIPCTSGSNLPHNAAAFNSPIAATAMSPNRQHRTTDNVASSCSGGSIGIGSCSFVPRFLQDQQPLHRHRHHHQHRHHPTSSYIRPQSPSDSSSCTYASVSFPMEPRVYNTIAPDLISQETTDQLQSHTQHLHLSESLAEAESDTESVRYSSIQESTFQNPSDTNDNTTACMSGLNVATVSRSKMDDSVYSGVLPYRINANSKPINGFREHRGSNNINGISCNSNNPVTSNSEACLNESEMNNDSSPMLYKSSDGERLEGGKMITLYASITDQSHLMDQKNCNADIQQSIDNNNDNSTDTNEADVDRILYGQAANNDNISNNNANNHNSNNNNFMLEFCTCSDDQHSSSMGGGCAGFLDDEGGGHTCNNKQHHQQQLHIDDDASSIATTINELQGSCNGCGRLIRQITYSESYSDETYEHVYSSRLLLRQGRRFSSPDITLSQVTNTVDAAYGLESPADDDDNNNNNNNNNHNNNSSSSNNNNNGDCFSRDDLWTARTDDVTATFYTSMNALAVNKKEAGGADEEEPSAGNLISSNSEKELEREGDRRPGQMLTTSLVDPASNSNDKSRKSFSSAFLSRENNPIIGNSALASCLAIHRASLPASIPSNLVPVTSSVSYFSSLSATQHSQQQQLPKSSAFSNLLSKLSRPKSKQTPKRDAVTSSNSNNVSTGVPKQFRNSDGDCVSNSDGSQVNPIPDRNTSKLSKFFQRLSTNEPESGDIIMRSKDKKRADDGKGKEVDSNVIEAETPASPALLRSSCCEENPSSDVKSDIHSINQSVDKNVLCQIHSRNQPLSKTGVLSTVSDNDTSKTNDTLVTPPISPDIYVDKNRPSTTKDDVSSSVMNEIAVDKLTSEASAFGVTHCAEQGPINGLDFSKGKPQNKTDSGDTCYEYDISTSSESEQTNYDHFLSKVKRSLNLEEEVQQIADMSDLRRKMFCKKCKKTDQQQSQSNSGVCDSFTGDLGCSHNSAKFGDLRNIFGDFVVDQRAAILDCLTDYAQGPFNIKGEGRDSLCPECGCEIVTSDSESMTTVYSLLSQQFCLTSGGGVHTPSCDSDDGTMADNSCESADDEDNDVSSGYDEAILPEPLNHKPKKKEKSREKNRKMLSSNATFNNANNSNLQHKDNTEKPKKKSYSESFHCSRRADCNTMDTNCYHALNGKRNCACEAVTTTCSAETCTGQPSTLTTTFEKIRANEDDMLTTTPTGVCLSAKVLTHNSTNSKDQGVVTATLSTEKYNEGATPTTGKVPKTRSLTSERVIQDIYAPLPSKALSWLTARNCESRGGLPCSCARSPHSSTSDLSEGKATAGYLTNKTFEGPPALSPSSMNIILGGRTLGGKLSNTATLSPPHSLCRDTDATDEALNGQDSLQLLQMPPHCSLTTVQSYCQTSHCTKDQQTTPHSANPTSNNDTEEDHNRTTIQNSPGHLPNAMQPAAAEREGKTAVDYDSVLLLYSPRRSAGKRKNLIEAPLSSTAVIDSSTIDEKQPLFSATDPNQTDLKCPFHVTQINALKNSKPGLPDIEFQSPENVGEERYAENNDSNNYTHECQISRKPAVVGIDPLQGVNRKLGHRLSQKQLQLAALDLLPETALGSDTEIDVANRENKQQPEISPKNSHPHRVSKVGRLAKMFENQSGPATPTSSKLDYTVTPPSNDCGKSSGQIANVPESRSIIPDSDNTEMHLDGNNDNINSFNSHNNDNNPPVVENAQCTINSNGPASDFKVNLVATKIHKIDFNAANKDADDVKDDNDDDDNTWVTEFSCRNDDDDNYNNSSQKNTTNNGGSEKGGNVKPTYTSGSVPSSSPNAPTTTTISTLIAPVPPNASSCTTTTIDSINSRAVAVEEKPTRQNHGHNLHSGGVGGGAVAFVAVATSPDGPLSPTTTTIDHPVSPSSPPTSFPASASSSSSSSRYHQHKDPSERGNPPDLNTNAIETSPKLSYCGSGEGKGCDLLSKTHAGVLSGKTKSVKLRRETKFLYETKTIESLREGDFCTINKAAVTSKSKDSGKVRTTTKDEPRTRKQIPASPSLSSSSGSSSRKHGQPKQKRLSKKSQLHQRRARSKSERRKTSSHRGREERMRYYFSSDLSDIDIIEVEDWEAYSSSLAVSKNTTSFSASPNNPSKNNFSLVETDVEKKKKISSRAFSGTTLDIDSARKLKDKSNKHKLYSNNNRNSSRCSSNSCDTKKTSSVNPVLSVAKTSGEDGLIQEVYSMPPSSSDIGGTSGLRESKDSCSPHLFSPPGGAQVANSVNATRASNKMAGKKTTDTIYKTKLNLNKLLSDVIIRNYDRKMYEMGSSDV